MTGNFRWAQGFILIAVSALAACAAPAEQERIDPSVKRAMESIAFVKSVDRTFTHGADAVKEAPAAVLTGDSLSVDYAGEAAPLLAQLAKAQNKTFGIYGKHPRLPLPIVVNVKNVPLLELAKDIGAQFGQRADLVLSATSLEIRYRDFNGK